MQMTTKTLINAEHFGWDGMYLFYFMEGKLWHNQCEANKKFIARFKYRKPWKSTIKAIQKHFTYIEDYLNLLDLGWSPTHALNLMGYRSKHDKEMEAEGTWDAYWEGTVAYQKKEEARRLAYRAEQEEIAAVSCACL